MTKNKKKYKTIRELKKDKLFRKDDLEMVVAFRFYEWINPDLLPNGKLVRYEDVNYLMKDSQNKYYMLCAVMDTDDIMRWKPYHNAYYIVAEVDYLQLHVVGNWTDKFRIMMASYEYSVPKYKAKHKVVFDHKCENKVKSNFFTIEEFTSVNTLCPVDFAFNSNLTNRVKRRKITTDNVFDIAEEHQLGRSYLETFQNLY